MKLNPLAILSTSSLLVATLASASYAINLIQAKPSPFNVPAKVQVVQNQPNLLMSGTFVAAEKPTNGAVKIVRDGGRYYLEFSDAFSTSDQGPDLHVLLDKNGQPPQTYQNINSAVNLGKLQKYKGAQRYPIPEAIDLAQFKSVVVWCRMANATFGYAPLHSMNKASR